MRRVLLLLLCVVLALADDSTPEVVAPIGRIRGSRLKSRLGRVIFAFRGVRYAEPPVGVRRFQAPIPVGDWENVFDGTEDGPACPRLDPQRLNMSEDCLRLNVYSTKLPSETENVKRPVLVFIHPGGFYTSSGQSLSYGPEYIMDRDIVLVTMNYRLAMLGFLSTGDSLAPGNLGLKDQVIALRWVKRNIAAFGGDPDSVTLSGYSVGGLSVLLHMVSPMSEGLFHRAIAMSSSAMTLEPFPTQQKQLAKKLAELLDCPSDTTGSMLICLNSKPMENFTDIIYQFFEWHGDPILIWKPVVEPEIHGVERFLPDQPVKLIIEGKFHQVPLIIGITKDEFGGVVTAFEAAQRRGDDSFYRKFNDDFESIAPISFMYERNTAKSHNISRELREFYFGQETISSTNSDAIGHIYADSIIIFPSHRSAKLIAEHSKEPVYFYVFTQEGRYSGVKWNETSNFGVVHGDDLQYLFLMKTYVPLINKDEPEVPMIERYSRIVENFVQSGEPIPSDDESFANVTWSRFVPERDNYLDISLEPVMKTGIYPERMAIWEKVFPVNQSYCNDCTQFL